MGDPIPAKNALRREMRALRKALPDQEERSERLWRHVRSLEVVQQATSIMVFTSVNGEPRTTAFNEWCRSNGKAVAVPEDDPVPDAAFIDVMIVPGTAFTAAGQRLGQGGGWYDRFLPGRRTDCVTIGVCFEPQLVDRIPIESHDVVLDLVVTDAGVAGAGDGT